jgi:ribosomal protein S14
VAHMSDAKPLRCQKCGKPLGYVTVAPKSFLATKPSVENIKLVATCPECSGGKGFYRRNF